MKIKYAGKTALRKLFELGQAWGFDVLPRHYYSEIPHISLLRKDRSWMAPYTMIGVEGADLIAQTRFLRECCDPAFSIPPDTQIHRNACTDNGHDGYGPIEADFLHSFIRSKRVRNIFQIGCGVSTAVIVNAAREAGYVPKIQCVEPFPNTYLRRLAGQQVISLHEEKAQRIPLDLIDALPNDVLFFVDSSHTLGPAGEASRIILEFLPRLKEGAWIHFHDVYFPYDYPRDLITSGLFFPHESVLLLAYMTNNRNVRLKLSMSMLHYAAPREIQEVLSNYRPATNDAGLQAGPGHFPSATYLQVQG